MSDPRIVEGLLQALDGCRSVLDVGSGLGLYLRRLPGSVTHRAALDAYEPYLEQSIADMVYRGTAQRVLPEIPNGRFDGVMALDFIEHLEKPDALTVLAEMKRIAARKVVVFTPQGFHRQEPGMPGSNLTQAEWEWQTHRSGWEADELEALGFAVDVWDFDYGKGDGLAKGLWAVLSK